jgi:23S rRNA (uracil1939-C5)-methyltransferase
MVENLKEVVPPRKNDIVELKITGYAFGGKGIAKINTTHGEFIIFVQNSFPGQLVKTRIIEKQKNFAQGTVMEVIEKSPDEITNNYQAIGGAPYATLPIEIQENYKKTTALDHYKRIGKVENADEIFDGFISSPLIWHYRNKMEYSFAAIRFDFLTQSQKDEFAFGFKHPGTWWCVENLDADSGLFDAQVENNLVVIRKFCAETNLPAWHAPQKKGFFRFLTVRKSFANNQLLFNLVTSSTDIDKFNLDEFVDLLKSLFGNRLKGLLHTINDEIGDRAQPNAGSSKLVYGAEKIVENILGLNFEISMHSFFQTNPVCAEKLYSRVVDYVFENETDPEKYIMDLFCGTGTIAQIIASKLKSNRIIGVDIVETAIADAKENALRNNIKNVEFFAADVGKFLHNYPEYQSKISTVVLDPPRGGIAPKTLQKIILLNAQNIVYVSCNPSTQARDIKMLEENGYSLKKFCFVDQFPHTSHIESIAQFIKKF